MNINVATYMHGNVNCSLLTNAHVMFEISFHTFLNYLVHGCNQLNIIITILLKLMIITLLLYHFYIYLFHNDLLQHLRKSDFNKTTPVTIEMFNFTDKIASKEVWVSKPFMIYEGGYKMCLRVNAAGYGAGKGTHVSVYLHLMKGPHDDKLEQSGHWPLRGTFTIELLNQYTNHGHYTRSMCYPVTVMNVLIE